MQTSGPADVPSASKLESHGVTDVRVSARGDATLINQEDLPVCWICLDTASPGKPLLQPCNCPRQAHPTCSARWQLQSAGTRKETHCEFCDRQLPDWKTILTPHCGANAPAIMNVNFDDRTFSFEVKPGIDGYKQFTDSIRQAFGLPDDSELNITFTCDEPVTNGTESPAVEPPVTPQPAPSVPRMVSPASTPPSPTSASLLTLQGAGAYDAAVHCASVSAARRMSQHSPSTTPGLQGIGSPFIAGRPHQFLGVPMLGSESFYGRMPRSVDNGQRPHLPPLTNPEESSRSSSSTRRPSNTMQRAFKAVRKTFTPSGRKDKD